jgi:hypothetical protein
MSTTEQDLRREAIRRRLSGHCRKDICCDLGRSTRWFDKWWNEFQHNPSTTFADQSRAPLTVSSKTPQEIERLIVELRQRLESSCPGLVGARAVWGQLKELHVKPLPSETTIQRILAKHSLTHPLGAASQTAYYPWLPRWEINSVLATDIITRHLRGGAEVQNFHTLDLFSQAACLSQHTDKTSTTSCSHVLKSWEKLGIPWLHQFDNEGVFCGGHSHRLILGRVVRLCLLCGVEAFFTPVYEAKRNHEIETFHGLWVKAFWSRYEFSSIADVRQSPEFWHWHYYHYRPPCLQGKTPAQVRHGSRVRKLSKELSRLIPDFANERLPVTAGRIHIMRKVNAAGCVNVLNESWMVGKKWIGEYVRATIDTGKQTLSINYQAAEEADWKTIKTRVFRIKESVHDVQPQFKRNRARCYDYLPG